MLEMELNLNILYFFFWVYIEGSQVIISKKKIAFLSLKIDFVKANSVYPDPDHDPQNVGPDLDLNS